MSDARSGRMPWRRLLDDAVAGHEHLDPHPGGPALASLDVPRIRAWRPGAIDAEWAVAPELTNLRGELFGGYYGVLADVVLAFTAMTVVTEEERFKTNDLQIAYFRPAPVGPVRIEGVVVNRTRRTIHAEARLYGAGSGEEKPLARALASFTVVPAEG